MEVSSINKITYPSLSLVSDSSSVKNRTIDCTSEAFSFLLNTVFLAVGSICLCTLGVNKIKLDLFNALSLCLSPFYGNCPWFLRDILFSKINYLNLIFVANMHPF